MVEQSLLRNCPGVSAAVACELRLLAVLWVRDSVPHRAVPSLRARSRIRYVERCTVLLGQGLYASFWWSARNEQRLVSLIAGGVLVRELEIYAGTFLNIAVV